MYWPDWELNYTLVKEEPQLGRSQETTDRGRIARFELQLEMELLGSTRCFSCSGFGHTKADCPTDERLSMLSNATEEWKTLIAWAREKSRAGGQVRNSLWTSDPMYH